MKPGKRELYSLPSRYITAQYRHAEKQNEIILVQKNKLLDKRSAFCGCGRKLWRVHQCGKFMNIQIFL
jgi:hypothetical protein